MLSPFDWTQTVALGGSIWRGHVTSLRLYAESPWLRAQQADVERILAATPPPRPEPVAAPVVAAPADWRKYFRDLDEAISARNWTEAELLIATVRRARPAPAWLDTHDAELLLREVRLAQGRQDALALRRDLNLYLNGSLERAAEVLKFARELHATGALDGALTLVKAVLEKSPDHPMATRLLAEWEPRQKN